MKLKLHPFQENATYHLRQMVSEALGGYHRTHAPQVVSFTAPTGSGKTIVMASLMECIYQGTERFTDQEEAIFVWLSDSPELNLQSRMKLERYADQITMPQLITIEGDSFDQEYLEDGHVYFLNTQKLASGNHLVTYSDNRTYTIWDTLRNTVFDKSDRLYFIIDEAHRGMQGQVATARATSIMQKFLKGSDEDELPPMPVVIGMTATPARFHKLVEGISHTTHYCEISVDEVRSSGLLKDRIIITYPETQDAGKDMAVLQAACDDWKDKWDRWDLYCREQHYAYVNPVFIIQVQNGSGGKASDTDLDDCLLKIEQRLGVHFAEGEVVHSFGDKAAAIEVNGLNVRYIEPSRIADDRKIKVVFFKESLSTGWDCPRAETMMSFRHATDATYIAQLLGRMIRTPMQMHIQVDEKLNDVRLFVPYFDKDTVGQVVDAFQNSEGGELPTDVESESLGKSRYVTWGVRPKVKCPTPSSASQEPATAGQYGMHWSSPSEVSIAEQGTMSSLETTTGSFSETPSDNYTGRMDNCGVSSTHTETPDRETDIDSPQQLTEAFKADMDAVIADGHQVQPEIITFEDGIDREDIIRAINDEGILTYEVRSKRRNEDDVKSMFSILRLLEQSGINTDERRETKATIAGMIADYVDELKMNDQYEKLASSVRQFRLDTQIFDPFGEAIGTNPLQEWYETTESDIDRQLRHADLILGGDGISTVYANLYAEEDIAAYKTDVILYAADEACLERLRSYAKEQYHTLIDTYRIPITRLHDEDALAQYNRIVRDGATVSEHSFRIPESLSMETDDSGNAYTDHLLLDEENGIAKIRLNTWEEETIREERRRPDYLCFLRNPSRKPWALQIPYQQDDTIKPMYPDFLIIRRYDEHSYIFDILEPHDQTRTDNLGKAKGLVEYAKKNPHIGRIQLIRKLLKGGKERLIRLDLAKSEVQQAVMKAVDDTALKKVFETFGFSDA